MTQEISCAHCGQPNTHHFAVIVYDRAEDADNTNRCVVTTNNAPDLAPATANFGFSVKHDTQHSTLSRNPSPRRHGLTVQMGCEQCDGITDLHIYQHKGTTYMSVEKGRP